MQSVDLLRFGSRGSDTAAGLIRFALFFGAHGAVDVTVRALAAPDQGRAQRGPLIVAAVASNPGPALLVVAVVVLALWRDPLRYLGRWPAIDHGVELRWLAAPLVVVLTWQRALQPYDYLLERTNAFDRSLLVVLAVGALLRPALLLAFVIQQEVMLAPLAFPFDSVQGQNIDGLLLTVLIALAAGHLVVAVTRVDDTAPVMAVVIAAVAAHLFVPGRGKLFNGWFGAEDLRYLPANAATAGWLGQTDGDLSRSLTGLMGALGPVPRVATLVLEVGAGLAAAHHRWFRWWLLPAVAFHLVNFVILGYWFLGWILVEVGLFLLLGRGGDERRRWLDRNATPGRALVVLMAVAAGGLLFHPPRLAWFDTPVAHGYRIEAEGESGAAYHVPFGALAPFEQDLAFGRLVLGTTGRVTGPYGVTGSTDDLERLRGLSDPAEVEAIRGPLDPQELAARDRSEAFVATWVDRANQRARGDGPVLDRLWSLRAPTWFWTGRPEPVYRFQEPIRRLRVDLVTSLVTGDDTVRWSETVLVVAVDADGVARVTGR